MAATGFVMDFLVGGPEHQRPCATLANSAAHGPERLCAAFLEARSGLRDAAIQDVDVASKGPYKNP